MLLELRNQKSVVEFLINKVIVGVCGGSSHEQRTTYEDYLDKIVPKGSDYRHTMIQYRLWWEKQEGNLFSEWANSDYRGNARILGITAASIVHSFHNRKVFAPHAGEGQCTELTDLLWNSDTLGLTYTPDLLNYYQRLLNGHNYAASAAYISIGWNRVRGLNAEEFLPEENRRGLIGHMPLDIQFPIVQGLCAYGLGVAQNEAPCHSSTPSA